MVLSEGDAPVFSNRKAIRSTPRRTFGMKNQHLPPMRRPLRRPPCIALQIVSPDPAGCKRLQPLSCHPPASFPALPRISKSLETDGMGGSSRSVCALFQRRHPEAPRFHQRGEGSRAKYFKLTRYPGGASLDMLTVRCLSSYLFFPPVLVTSKPRAGATARDSIGPYPVSILSADLREMI